LLIGALLPFASSPLFLRQLVGGSSTLVVWLRRLFPDVRAAATLGGLYLHHRPEERSAAWLAQTLFGREASCDSDRDGEKLLERVRTSRRLDFCNDDLVVLNGWSVTRTEARLLALVSLAPPAK
jgi:hypothetical protein